MNCIYCGNPETKVTNKRKAGEAIRRRRECLKCARRFTTYETPTLEITVIKRDGTREPFNPDKLKRGITIACQKRPIPTEKIEKMIQEIEETLRKRGAEVKSSFIGETIMKKLEKLDKVAYVRFASVYKDFKDVSDFKKELKGLG
jgi:transcriptional repressor NrdR